MNESSRWYVIFLSLYRVKNIKRGRRINDRNKYGTRNLQQNAVIVADTVFSQGRSQALGPLLAYLALRVRLLQEHCCSSSFLLEHQRILLMQRNTPF